MRLQVQRKASGALRFAKCRAWFAKYLLHSRVLFGGLQEKTRNYFCGLARRVPATRCLGSLK
jgi:hypothetical protein